MTYYAQTYNVCRKGRTVKHGMCTKPTIHKKLSRLIGANDVLNYDLKGTPHLTHLKRKPLFFVTNVFSVSKLILWYLNIKLKCY